MRIVLDAMGGDYAPAVVVDGGVQAAREYGVEVVLVGRREAVEPELTKYDTAGLA
ncbi:MAG: phosphate--acyl-ACP acyltransferase, partial [Anaerolineae bacterium]|nr:phosphate--acyl-ACP acyltransferase [Anaerolineae bacterium]